MNKKAFIFLADGFEEIEAITPIDILRRAEISVTTISLNKNVEVTGAHDISVEADFLIEDASFNNIDLLILPGGIPGTDNLKRSALLKEKLTEFNNQGKLIAAICAAPTVLSDLGILSNKTATCYPNYQSQLNCATVVNSNVVVDGNIITSKGVGTAIEFSLKLVELLKSKEDAEKIAKAILVK